MDTNKGVIVMSNKKQNIFIERDFDKNVESSKDIPGAMISYSWKISEKRCNEGEDIVLVTSWSKGTFYRGKILGKFKTNRNGENRWAIIFKLTAVGVFAGLHNVVPNTHREKNYVNAGTFDTVVCNPPYNS